MKYMMCIFVWLRSLEAAPILIQRSIFCHFVVKDINNLFLGKQKIFPEIYIFRYLHMAFTGFEMFFVLCLSANLLKSVFKKFCSISRIKVLAACLLIR